MLLVLLFLFSFLSIHFRKQTDESKILFNRISKRQTPRFIEAFVCMVKRSFLLTQTIQGFD